MVLAVCLFMGDASFALALVQRDHVGHRAHLRVASRTMPARRCATVRAVHLACTCMRSAHCRGCGFRRSYLRRERVDPYVTTWVGRTHSYRIRAPNSQSARGDVDGEREQRGVEDEGEDAV